MAKKALLRSAVVILVAAAGVYMFKDQLSTFSGPMSRERAVQKLDSLVGGLQLSRNTVARRAKIELGSGRDLKSTLPEISEFALVVKPAVTGNDVGVEIFASTEKSGTGTDGWIVEVAQAFNQQNQRLSGGARARVAIRKIASGTGYQFIASRKYLPDAFTPSNHLWIAMAEADGVEMTPIQDRLVGNLAGVVMKSSVADRLRENYGSLGVKSIVDGTVQGQVAMGYTNPFASSTGLNFLVTVLSRFSGAETAKMLSPEVASAFESFQQGVPFVGQTTLQLRESVRNDGSLDAFVMEYQTFANTPVLQSGYEFVPFGIPHDNPLYAVGKLGSDKLEALKKFAEFAGQSEFTRLASEYRFNPSIEYTPDLKLPDGDVLIQAQGLWKEKKDVGRPIAAIFLCDVSGSMRGSRLSGVKRALIEGSKFIASQNAIGLMIFGDRVNATLPIRRFDLNQKATFIAAVEDMHAGGKTAMYDAVSLALSELLKYAQANPEVRPLLFVLSDGQTNVGLGFDDVRDAIEGINVPIYTIGYEANLEELKRLSLLVEAASLNSNEGQINYKIGSLLNAQM